MTNHAAYEITPDVLDNWYYAGEWYVAVTDENGTQVPMRLPEFRYRHAAKGGDE